MSTVTDAVKLPHVRLRGKPMPLTALSYVPIETADKYKIIVFAVTADSLHLAVVHPEQLKQGFYIALKDLGKKIDKHIKLFQTDSGSFKYALQHYKEKLNPPPPPLFELGKTVAFRYLKRVPIEFARKHHIACVDYQEPNTYWFLVDKENAGQAQATLAYIEEKNEVRAFAVPVEVSQITSLLEYYQSLILQEIQREKVEDKDHAAHNKHAKKTKVKALKFDDSFLGESEVEESDHKEQEITLAQGVVVPDIQAEILSVEEKRKGLAGVWQTVSQSMIPAADFENDILKDDEEVAPNNSGSEEAPESLGTSTGSSTDAISVDPIPGSTGSSATEDSDASVPSVAVSGTPSSPKPVQKNVGDEKDLGRLLKKPVETKDELIGHIRAGSIPLIVAATVNFAIHEKASDIHIESFEDEVRIRFRMDGQLMDIVKIPPDVHSAVVSRIKILSRLRLDETRVPQDGRFDVNFNEAQVDVRVSVLPTVHGEKVVLRILDKSKGVTSLDALGIEGLAYKNLTEAVKKPYGICLATGPTGSGKSTSLYALLQLIALPSVNVVTLEDPIEYEMKGINQSQVRPKIGFTFAEGLRSVLRQDPNIIMVGEIRDGETAAMTIQSALTGHLVLSTLHTNDAAGAIPRLNNMGIEPFLITSSLNAAMGQRLVRRICPNCKEKTSLPEGVKDKFLKEIDEMRVSHPHEAKRLPVDLDFYHGAGCDQCRRSGYQGRVGIYEVLVMSEKIEDLTIKNASASEIKIQAQKEGMITMYQDGLIKAISGITTLDEVLRETTNK